MYRKKKNTRLEKSNRIIYWLKRKVLTIITAFMLGMSNSLNNDDKSVFDNEFRIEQRDKKD